MDYNCWIRTNYFAVTDEDTFLKTINECLANGSMEVITQEEKDRTRYGFLCEGSIFGSDEGEGCGDFDSFIKSLQEILPPGEAILLQEIGHEGFRYLVGSVLIITANDVRYVNMQAKALEEARILLDNDDFETQMEY